MPKQKEVDKDFDLEKEDIYCYDCADKNIKTKIEIKDGDILNGIQLFFNTRDGKICIFKCNECYKIFKGLKNYQECEVYARVVGYIRPVKGWNPGRVAEYSDRLVYDIKEKKDE